MTALGVSAELRALDWIIDLVYERSHIRLTRAKEALIRARLGKRMRALRIETLPAYCDYLRSAQGAGEAPSALDALTTNFTHFLREQDHFQFMVAQALPALLGRGKRRFSVWSAACATGEEPYTIAFHLDDKFPPAEGWDWKILATDISGRALEKAVRGVYPEERIACLPSGWPRKYFQQGFATCAGLYKVKPFLQQRVNFKKMNLLEPGNLGEDFEIIFCRNVMIYFDRPTQETLAGHLSRALVPGGYLFTGRAESLGGLSLPLRCLSPSIYQKPE